MSLYLNPVIGATALWFTRAYPAPPSPIDRALAHTQARQAVTVAAWLRYPTELDAALVQLAGPGGTGNLDLVLPAEGAVSGSWRSWVDEVVASWAACLLGETELAQTAVAAVGACEHAAGLVFDFRRLLAPDEADLRAGVLLRHPDLLAPVADLHRQGLHEHLAAAQLSGR